MVVADFVVVVIQLPIDGLLDMVHPTESHDTSKLNFLFLYNKTKQNKTKQNI